METLFQMKERCSKELLTIVEKAFKDNNLITIAINNHTLGVYTPEGKFLKEYAEKSLKEYEEWKKLNNI